MMIRLENLSKRFGALEVLRSLSLEVRRDEWLGLFGHNGSGKTTLLRILLGLSKPSSGRLLLDEKVPDAAAWRRFRAGLGFMPERINLYEHMTGEETLAYFARLRGADTEHLTALLARVGLAEAGHRKVGEYSKGMRQRLNLAQALLGDPEILVLDEPSEGLDPQGVRDFFRLLRGGGIRTVVLSSHHLAEACREVDRICVLSNGEVKAEGTVEDLALKLRRPVRIHLHTATPLDGTWSAALLALGASSLAAEEGTVVAEVPQERKTAFLFGLHAHRDAIRHLRVEEPSIEEIYFETD